jgi:phage shock protein C
MDRLARSESDHMIAGVCGGIASYIGVDSVFVRGAFLLLIPASGIGLILYLVLMIIMPPESMVDQPPGSFVQQNIDDLGEVISKGFEQAGQQSRGPMIVGLVLILLGSYFLIENLGWFPAQFIWPLLLVAVGVYLLRRN